jgi:hypothetical protein
LGRGVAHVTTVVKELQKRVGISMAPTACCVVEIDSFFFAWLVSTSVLWVWDVGRVTPVLCVDSSVAGTCCPMGRCPGCERHVRRLCAAAASYMWGGGPVWLHELASLLSSLLNIPNWSFLVHRHVLSCFYVFQTANCTKYQEHHCSRGLSLLLSDFHRIL